MAYYRTYRPQTIGDLDSVRVRESLGAIIASGKIPHAFLFAGPKGTGKTSTARIVAKILNCDKTKEQKIRKAKKQFEPCNKCDSCKAVMKGMHIDVYEIDGASNRGIDDIRDLREKIHLSPAMGGSKVYIVDEVHMLTREAFNALLKTLEEPPEHAYFILATTEPHKLPDTILSRCTKLQFSKATNAELVSSIKRVIAGEELSIDDESIDIIAKHSGGSFRDAVKLLEQAVRENRLKPNEISQLVGVSSQQHELLSMIALKQTKEALEIIQTQIENGIDFLVLIGGLLDELHVMLLYKYGVGSGDDENTSIQKSMSTTDIQKLIRLLARAHGQTKTSYIESLPLELAVIEYTYQ